MPPSPEQLERWPTRLRLFTFQPSRHTNDGDALKATLPFANERELVALFDRLGRPLVELPSDAAVPVAGCQYTIEEYEALRQPLPLFPKYEAPSRTELFGVSVYVTVDKASVGVFVSGADGNPYEVTERDFENALSIEAALAESGGFPG